MGSVNKKKLFSHLELFNQCTHLAKNPDATPAGWGLLSKMTQDDNRVQFARCSVVIVRVVVCAEWLRWLPPDAASSPCSAHPGLWQCTAAHGPTVVSSVIIYTSLIITALFLWLDLQRPEVVQNGVQQGHQDKVKARYLHLQILCLQ